MNSSADPTEHITVEPRKLGGASASQIQPVPVEVEPVQEQVIPDRGWPKTWYWIMLRFNKNAKVPKINKAQVAEIERHEQALRQAEAVAERVAAEAKAEADRVEARRQSILRLRELSDLKPRLTVAYIGVKGAAGTTTTMVGSTSTFSDITRTLVYAGDFNPASGSAGSRLGKDPNETMSLREYREMVEAIDDRFDALKDQIAAATPTAIENLDLRGLVDNIDSRAEINARLRPTKYGVRVLSADDYILETTEQFGTTTVKMLDILSKNCDYLFVDTANDITTAASRAVLQKADVLVFTANVGIKDSLFMLYTSMEKVRQLNLSAKVANSVVVISNIPQGAQLDDYRKYLNRVKPSTDEVIQYIDSKDFHGPFMGVPHDPVIARDGQVELEQFAHATYQAYVDVDITIFEQALNIEPVNTIAPHRTAPQFDSQLVQQAPAG